MATKAYNDPKTKKPLHSFHVHEFNPVFKAHAKMYLYVCFLLYFVSMYREKKREKILQSLEKSPAGHWWIFHKLGDLQLSSFKLGTIELPPDPTLSTLPTFGRICRGQECQKDHRQPIHALDILLPLPWSSALYWWSLVLDFFRIHWFVRIEDVQRLLFRAVESFKMDF